MAVDIGQTALETIVIVSETLVVQAHEVQDSSIEIVNGGATGHRFKPELITLAVAVSLLDTGPREETGESIRIVIASCAIALEERHATELGTPDDQGVVEQTAALQIMDQGSGGLVHDLRLHGMSLEYIRMRIPVGDTVATGRIASVEKLDYTNPFLNQSTSQDTVFGVLALQVTPILCAIFALNRMRFPGNIHHFGHRGLHTTGQFVTRYASSQIGVTWVCFEVPVVETLQQVDRGTIIRWSVGHGTG